MSLKIGATDAKGRTARGPDFVELVRALREQLPKLTQSEIGKRLGVSKSVINGIVGRSDMPRSPSIIMRRWRELEPREPKPAPVVVPAQPSVPTLAELVPLRSLGQCP